MITRIEALNYRCLHYVRQDLGTFHVLVGPNASGKSTFLDVLAIMADVVNRGPLEAVQIRASHYRDLFWMRKGESFEVAIEAGIPETVRIPLRSKSYDHCRYELSIGKLPESREMGILSERLCLLKCQRAEGVQADLFPRTQPAPDTIFRRSTRGGKVLVSKASGGNDTFHSETGRWVHVFRLGPHKSALASLPEDVDKFPVSTWFKRMLSEGTQLLRLDSGAIRRPSAPGLPRRLLSDGSNLPWVLRDLQRQDRDRFREWVGHVQTALRDLVSIRTVSRPEDRHRYIVLRYENGLKVPSWTVSDGTLRFLALTLLPYLPGMRGVYLIEEPENGIHPKALEAVYQSLSSVYEGQVLVATHSPIFLTVSKLSDVLCFALNEEGSVDIVEGPRHPRLRYWRNEVPLADLFAAGILA
jgi:predicted ATPase